MTTKTFAQIIILGGLIALVLACITAAMIVTGPDWLPGVQSPAETPVAAKQFTPQPTFTATSTPEPPSPTSPPSSLAFPSDPKPKLLQIHEAAPIPRRGGFLFQSGRSNTEKNLSSTTLSTKFATSTQEPCIMANCFVK